MNRNQKKQKAKLATFHKVKCKWLKGGNPRQMRMHRDRLFYKMRLSRSSIHRISLRTMDRYTNYVPKIDLGSPVEL